MLKSHSVSFVSGIASAILILAGSAYGQETKPAAPQKPQHVVILEPLKAKAEAEKKASLEAKALKDQLLDYVSKLEVAYDVVRDSAYGEAIDKNGTLANLDKLIRGEGLPRVEIDKTDPKKKTQTVKLKDAKILEYLSDEEFDRIETVLEIAIAEDAGNDNAINRAKRSAATILRKVEARREALRSDEKTRDKNAAATLAAIDALDDANRAVSAIGEMLVNACPVPAELEAREAKLNDELAKLTEQKENATNDAEKLALEGKIADVNTKLAKLETCKEPSAQALTDLQSVKPDAPIHTQADHLVSANEKYRSIRENLGIAHVVPKAAAATETKKTEEKK